MNSEIITTRPTKFILFVILFLTHQVPGISQSNNSGEVLHEVFEKVKKHDKEQRLFITKEGQRHPYEIKDLSDQDFQEQLSKKTKLLSQLKVISDEELSHIDQISKSVMELKLTGEINQLRFKSYLIPFNAEGGFFNNLTYRLPNLPFNTEADVQAYADWLPEYADYLDQNIELMRVGIKNGKIAPQVIVNNIINLLNDWTTEDESHPLYQPLRSVELMKIVDKKTLDLTKNQIRMVVIPKYQEVMDFMKNQYLPSAMTRPGISHLKDGKRYYEDRVHHFTTLDMSPEDVYDTGINEVARIRENMLNIIEGLEYNGTFDEFLAFLRTDEQFYAKTGQELLSRASWLSKKAEGQLPKLFSNLYDLPFTVEPVPDAIAPNYTGGRYVPGSRSQNRAGIYWVNTYNLPSRTLYTLPALTVHESVPGHHLQIMHAATLENLPDFRKNYYISAFGEGWGLYSEFLGEEMGMYETPYELFGRYTYEMWRACRLVVDVGLHYKDWSRQEAIDYMTENTALSIHEINTEIDRYIGWPAQAVSYKIGELTIKDLRKKAASALGANFSIQDFHETVLKNGSVPLGILQSEVEEYIQANMK